MTLDAWVVMPNHVHGIIVIGNDVVGARHSESVPTTTEESFSSQDSRPDDHQMGNALPRQPPHGVTPGSLGAIVGSFKSVTTRRINRIHHTPGQRVWQRDYYERIARDEQALRRIRQYIHDNPARWREDIENLATRPAPTLKETAAYYGSIWDEEI